MIRLPEVRRIGANGRTSAAVMRAALELRSRLTSKRVGEADSADDVTDDITTLSLRASPMEPERVHAYLRREAAKSKGVVQGSALEYGRVTTLSAGNKSSARVAEPDGYLDGPPAAIPGLKLDDAKV